jgi:hypothetical protein
MMKKLKYSLTELVAELDRRDILISTDGEKVFFELPKGTYWNDLQEAVIYYKPALIDVAVQRQ